MFLLVGKGLIFKEELIRKLGEWGIVNVENVVSKVEQTGFTQCGRHKILLVK